MRHRTEVSRVRVAVAAGLAAGLATGLATGLAGGLSIAVVGGAAPAAAAGARLIPCDAIQTTGSDPDLGAIGKVRAGPDPAAELEVDAARRAVRTTGHEPGAGIEVAVIDSGVEGRAARPGFTGRQRSGEYFHGTVVANLIHGIAPRARLIDLPVWVQPDPRTGRTGYVDGRAVAGALDELLARPGRLDRLVVNLSLHLPGSAALRHRIEALVDRGAMVVAAAGNLGDPGTDTGTAAQPSPPPSGADFADRIEPAGYPGTVAVGVSATPGLGGDATEAVLPNSATDIVAPTAGARSRTLYGVRCVIESMATSWSTAEVSGVLALVASADPRATGREVIDRVLRTADGRAEQGSRYTGAGVVSAYDAVTRPLASSDSGDSGDSARVARAPLDPPADDVLAGTRSHTVWWGLIGGGALLLGLVVRPLFRRR
ncbi:MAG: S8 family serine peptidase [Nocardioides sp.]|uniref:S8 family serine peptidase n=1 Tax=Nocardioides sp. TaxID=35761 RepID=UPI0039E4CC0D